MFKEKIVKELTNVLESKGFEGISVEGFIEVPPSPELGDYAFPCFRLAKQMRKSPIEIATELAGVFAELSWIKDVVANNGYLNFFIDPDHYSREVVGQILEQGEDYGARNYGGTVVIDFSSPNIAKPFSVGHIRSTVIGNSLAKIHKHLGFAVERINHLGDWGTQFGKLMVAYKSWGDSPALQEEPLKELLRIYVKYHQEAEKDGSLDDNARAWFKKLEDGDQEALELWKEFRKVSLIEFKRVYERLGVEFDSYDGESFFNDKMEAIVNYLEEKQLLSESDGALVVDVGEDLPPCLIKKKDGATLYATRDITAATYRWDKYKFEKLLYVVGVTQSLHFEQVFRVLKQMGYSWADRCIHVPFGTILFGEESMSTRKGNVIFLEDILDQAVNKVKEILKERNLPADQGTDIAEKVGVGAVIFNELSHNRIKDIEFDLDKIISFEGDTGPYVQYTLTRIKSLLRKADDREYNEFNPECLTDAEALSLVRQLEKFPQVIEKAGRNNEPSLVARYCLDLAASFNSLYHNHRIIGSGEEMECARLAITKATNLVLSLGLSLLGVPIPDAM